MFNQEIACRHFDRCSGCVHNHQVDQLALFEKARLFFEERHITLGSLITGPARGWRYRAKLVVAKSSEDPTRLVIGLYRARTHDVESIPECQVHHPQIQEAIAVLQRCLEQEQIPAYDEKSGKGLLRYLLLSFEEESAAIQLSFVVTACEPSFWKGLLHRLFEQAPALWHSIWLNHNARLDNVIWGEHWELLWGKPWLHMRVGMASMALHPGSFFQANVPLFRTLVRQLSEWVPRDCRLLELYSGCGVMGLHLAVAQGCQVTLCERNPFSQKAFDASLARISLEIDRPLNVEFKVGCAEKELELLDGAECILVDPPRKGLEPALVSALGWCKLGARLFYMSCGWEGFMRDCDALCDLGWSLKQAKSYLFFPGTEHIELLVEFEKRADP